MPRVPGTIHGSSITHVILTVRRSRRRAVSSLHCRGRRPEERVSRLPRKTCRPSSGIHGSSMARSPARRSVPKMCGDGVHGHPASSALSPPGFLANVISPSYRVRRKARPLAAEDHIVSESDALLFARRIPVRSAAQPLAFGKFRSLLAPSTRIAISSTTPHPAQPAQGYRASFDPSRTLNARKSTS
jgi:hypothetical protein